MTQSLYIEYKADVTSVPYELIIRKGGSDVWKRVSADVDLVIRNASANEALRLSTVLKLLNSDVTVGPTKVAQLFPQLQTIAVSSVYGRSSDKWEIYGIQRHSPDEHVPTAEHIFASARAWREILSKISAKHVCVRNTQGPLGFVTGFGAGSGPAKTFHLEQTDQTGDAPAVIFGEKVRWIFDAAPTSDWDPYYMTVRMALSHGSSARQDPKTYLKVSEQTQCRAEGSAKIQVELYCSTGKIGLSQSPILDDLHMRNLLDGVLEGKFDNLCTDDQRLISATLGERFQLESRKDNDFLDVIDWRSSADAPICEACDHCGGK